jgi:hypothetical protein
MAFQDLSIAVLLSCEKETTLTAKAVLDFRRVLPNARVFVSGTNSDSTAAEQAARAGATVIPIRRGGKDHILQQMLTDIEADIYLLAGCEQSYDIFAAPDLIEKLIQDRLDMVVGIPKNQTPRSSKIFTAVFGDNVTDIVSGFRAITRRFAKSFAAEVPSNEINIGMSAHAAMLGLPVAEIECTPGTDSKNPAGNFKTLATSIKLHRELHPYRFYSRLSLGLFAFGLMLAAPTLAENIATGWALNMPIFMVSTALLIGAVMTLLTGLILDSVAKGRTERKRMFYVSLDASRGEKTLTSSAMAIERRGTEAPAMGPSYRAL